MSHATPIVRGFERHDPCADSSHRAIVTQLIDTIGGNASAWALTQNTVLTAVMGLVEAVYANAKANLTLAESQFALTLTRASFRCPGTWPVAQPDSN